MYQNNNYFSAMKIRGGASNDAPIYRAWIVLKNETLKH